MRPILRTTLLVLAVPAGILCVAASYILYLRYASERALDEALTAIEHHRRLPEHTRLDVLGMQELLQDPDRFAELLKPKPEVSDSGWAWWALPARGYWFEVDVNLDIGVLCEVYADDGWKIFCGQLRCIKPCIFLTRPNHPVWWEHTAQW